MSAGFDQIGYNVHYRYKDISKNMITYHQTDDVALSYSSYRVDTIYWLKQALMIITSFITKWKIKIITEKNAGNNIY